MRARKVLAGVVAGTAVLVVSTGPARADHVHSLQTGSGSCVLLAQKGGEKYVQLPFATDFGLNRRHPLHVLVHLGKPGQRLTITVAGSDNDPCSTGTYVNKR